MLIASSSMEQLSNNRYAYWDNVRKILASKKNKTINGVPLSYETRNNSAVTKVTIGNESFRLVNLAYFGGWYLSQPGWVFQGLINRNVMVRQKAFIDFNDQNNDIVKEIPTDCNIRFTVDMWDDSFSLKKAVKIQTSNIFQSEFPHKYNSIFGVTRSDVSTLMSVLNTIQQMPMLTEGRRYRVSAAEIQHPILCCGWDARTCSSHSSSCR